MKLLGKVSKKTRGGLGWGWDMFAHTVDWH
jgi:hypothetical protein